MNIKKTVTIATKLATSGQSKGERGGTAFPHLLFLVYIVPPNTASKSAYTVNNC